MMKKTALLVVSFGTSYEETRQKTIDRLEEKMAQSFPELDVKRAWTSSMIMRKIEKRDGIHINNVKEALEELVDQGYERVIFQPTHIIGGEEYHKIVMQMRKFVHKIELAGIGMPLLSYSEDYEKLCKSVMKYAGPLGEDQALVLMGHGSQRHASDSAYAALDYRFKNLGYKNVHVATVEGFPVLEDAIKLLKDSQVKKVKLMPLMIVVGDHANNDMAGDDQDSWKNILAKEGYQVELIMKGLGEIAEIQDMYVDHAREVVDRLEG